MIFNVFFCIYSQFFCIFVRFYFSFLFFYFFFKYLILLIYSLLFLSLPKGQPKKNSSDGHSPAQEIEVRPHSVLVLLVILKSLKSLAIPFDHGKNMLQQIVSDCDIPHVIFVTFFVFF